MAEFIGSLSVPQMVMLCLTTAIAAVSVMFLAHMAWDLMTKWQRKAPGAPPVPPLGVDSLPTPPSIPSPSSDVRSFQYIYGKYFVAECLNGGEWDITSLDMTAKGSYSTDTREHAEELLREFDRFYHWKKVGRKAGLAA